MASHDANAVAGPSEAVSDWDSDIDDEFEQDDETTLGRTVGNGSGRTAAKRSRSSTVDSEVRALVAASCQEAIRELTSRAGPLFRLRRASITSTLSIPPRAAPVVQTQTQAKSCRPILRALQEAQGEGTPKALHPLPKSLAARQADPPSALPFQIKCDRKLPCESCIKRGEQGTCRWEQPKVEPPPCVPRIPCVHATLLNPARLWPRSQIFALAVEHEQLKRRVAVLEEALARLAPGVLDGAGAPILPVPPTRPGKTARQRSGTIKTGAEAHLLSQLGDGGEEEEEEAGESDHEVVEDAAQVLKTLGEPAPLFSRI